MSNVGSSSVASIRCARVDDPVMTEVIVAVETSKKPSFVKGEQPLLRLDDLQMNLSPTGYNPAEGPSSDKPPC
jgi:hypothetical protein